MRIASKDTNSERDVWASGNGKVEQSTNSLEITPGARPDVLQRKKGETSNPKMIGFRNEIFAAKNRVKSFPKRKLLPYKEIFRMFRAKIF